MNIEQLVAQFLSPLGDFEAAFDDIVAAGRRAIPALVSAIERGRGIPQLTAALSALELDDPVGALEPLLDGTDAVRDAGLLALGAHRDPRALPVIVEALPLARFVAAESLGDLGSADAVAPLLELVTKHVGAADGVRLPGVDWLRSPVRCRDLRLVLTVATALAKLGQPMLDEVVIHLATLRGSREHPDASAVRAHAVRSLYYIATPGVAHAIFIQFTMSILLNLRYGQGAFCRILCPYAPMMVPFMNRSPIQKKITRVAQCTGCRDCSNACPQGIDVSREIFHFNGKVVNTECIKCYACIDACDDNVLKDTAAPAVPQTDRLKPYEKRPWQQALVRKDGLLTNARHMQVFEPLGPVADFMSIIVALICGGITSRFGGFWFYPGAIMAFIIFRQCCLYAKRWSSVAKEKPAVVEQS
jgi:ferredoxin